MEDLKRLLKVVEESKEKRSKEYRKRLIESDPLNMLPSDFLELGKLQGKIEEKKEIADAIKRMIKAKEDKQKSDAKFEQSLKEIEEVMNILPLLVALGIINNKL